MIRDAPSDRTRRVTAAGAVLLAHVLLVWLALVARSGVEEPAPAPELFVMRMVELSRAPLPGGPAPIETRMQQPQLRMLAPRIQDIPVEQPEIPMPAPAVSPVMADAAPPASAPMTARTDAGLAGVSLDSSGASGGLDGLVLLQRVLPVYPPASVRNGEQGVTGMRVLVAESGAVKDVKLARSSGSGRLDRAALEAVRRWRFARMPAGSAPKGRWVSLEQGFFLYQFVFTRLNKGALESVYEEHLKPKPGEAEEATPGSAEALTGFISALRDGAFGAQGAGTRGDFAQLRTDLEKWGRVDAVQFTGLAGSTRWMRHRIRPESLNHGQQTVDVSWNMFEVRHENATSEWIIATDRDGKIWDIRATRSESL